MEFSGSNYDDWSNAENRIEQARDFYDRGELVEALRELNAAIDINPSNSNWLFNKALTLDTLERYHEAIEAFEEAHELAPDDLEIMNSLAVDYTRVGQHQRALEMFEELETVDPTFEPGYCNRIITYTEMGEHDKAEEMFYLARQLREHCPLCYYNMGNSLFSRQLYDRAIWCWQQTKAIESAHPQIDYRIAQAYWAKGEWAKAKEHFLMELRRHPGDIEVLLDMGLLLLEMNELDGAREKFHRILELRDDQPQVYHYLGELHLHRGEMAKALECFQRALRLNPATCGSNYRLGECYLLMGQTPNAREHLLAELRLSPDQPDVLMELGCFLERVGELTEAMKCFERYVDIRPNDHLGYHNLSLCYYHSGLIEQGIELSLKVLELQGDYIPAMHNLAYAFGMQKRYGRASEFLELACGLEPADRQLQSLRRQIKLQAVFHRVTAPWTSLLGKIKSATVKQV